MTPLLYLILEGIDLGDATHGVFTSKDMAEKALARMKEAYLAAGMKYDSKFFIVEFPANQIVCESWWWKKAQNA